MYLEIPFAINWVFDKKLLTQTYRDELRSSIITISKDPEVTCSLQLIVDWPGKKDLQIIFKLSDECAENLSLKMPYSIIIGEADSQGLYRDFCHVEQIIKNKDMCFFRIRCRDMFETWRSKNRMSEINKVNIKVLGFIYLGEKPPQIPIPYLDANDFLIVVGENVINVNKSHFKKMSPVFAGMIDSGLKEAKENKLEMTKFSFEIVKTVFKFFKGIEIPEDFMESNLDDLHEFADYYLMDSFKDALSERCKITTENVSEISKKATKFHSDPLQKRCFYFALQNPSHKGIYLIVEDFISYMQEKTKSFLIVKEDADVKELNRRWFIRNPNPYEEERHIEI